MNTTPKPQRPSGGRVGSGAPAAPARLPAAGEPSGTTAHNDDADTFLTLEGVYDLLKLSGPERCEASIAGVPACALGGGARRWLKSQVITWAALGGARPRHHISRRGRARTEF